MTNVSGMSKEKVRQAFHPIVVNNVQLVDGGFALVFLAVSDAVNILDKFSGDIKLRSGKKICPKPSKTRRMLQPSIGLASQSGTRNR